MDLLDTIVRQAGAALIGYSWVVGLLLSLELLWPKAPQCWRRRLRGLACLVVMAFAAAGIGALYRLGWSQLGVAPLLSVNLRGIESPTLRFAVATGLAVLIVDFGFYCRHRLQHALAWRFHAVHHAIKELNATSFYHHPSEELFHIAFTTLPLALLLDAPSTALASALVMLQAVYLHSSTRLTLGPLRYLIGDNAFHRIHHSLNPAHHGKNFSAFFPLFDVIFGTAYFPKPGEWPETGVAEMPEPATLAAYFAAPFHLKGRSVDAIQADHRTADVVARG